MTAYENTSLITPVQSPTVNPVLEFRDGQCLFRATMEGGTVCEKLISWADVRQAAQDIPIDSQWLPPQVRRWGLQRSGDWVVCFFEPDRYRLELITGTPGPEEIVERIVAPLPGLVLFGCGTSYWLWAVKEAELDPSKGLYRCPLPNVMADGAICWGPIKPPVASPRMALKAFELFMTSSFNNHAAGKKSRKCLDDCRLMLKELAGTPGDYALYDQAGAPTKPRVYPVEDLIPQHGLSLDDSLRHLWETGEFPL
jgi:hypothetical protein